MTLFAFPSVHTTPRRGGKKTYEGNSRNDRLITVIPTGVAAAYRSAQAVIRSAECVHTHTHSSDGAATDGRAASNGIFYATEAKKSPCMYPTGQQKFSAHTSCVSPHTGHTETGGEGKPRTQSGWDAPKRQTVREY